MSFSSVSDSNESNNSSSSESHDSTNNNNNEPVDKGGAKTGIGQLFGGFFNSKEKTDLEERLKKSTADDDASFGDMSSSHHSNDSWQTKLDETMGELQNDHNQAKKDIDSNEYGDMDTTMGQKKRRPTHQGQKGDEDEEGGYSYDQVSEM